MEQIIYFDEFGKRYCLDENNNKIPPMKSTIISKPEEFTSYNSSEGHCGLCGNLRCIGNCFK